MAIRNGSERASERGAVLVFVALAILVLASFLTFVIDEGVMWLSRGQAQNAADAGALAGAVARGFDDYADTSPTGKAYRSASQVAQANDIIGEAGVAEIAWTCPADAGLPADSCVRVDVMRGAPNRAGTVTGTPLQMYFGPLLNIATQGVRATATAVAANADTTTCLKPFVIPDHFIDANGNGRFDAGDTYTAPSASGIGTGYSLVDIGSPMTLKPKPQDKTFNTAGEYSLVNTTDLIAAIEGCVLTASIGETLDPAPRPPEPAEVAGSVAKGVSALVAHGPVVMTIAMFDPSRSDNTIVNMMGVMLDANSIQGSTIVGTLVGAAGELRAGGASIGGNNSLFKAVRLIR